MIRGSSELLSAPQLINRTAMVLFCIIRITGLRKAEMKKLFVLLRQGNIEEVDKIITARPELLDCVAGPSPKKDHGQSLLQVALKSGNLAIADYLIDKGINVDFMEAEDDDPGLRAPVLFDAITAAIDSLCINQFSTQEQIQNRFEKSEQALCLLRKIIANGADVNKRSSNGMSALNWSLHHAEMIMRNAVIYPFSQKKVRETLECILDLLIDHGADYKAWFEEGLYPEPCPGPSMKAIYLDKETSEPGINYEAVREMRSYIQAYVQNRSL